VLTKIQVLGKGSGCQAARPLAQVEAVPDASQACDVRVSVGSRRRKTRHAKSCAGKPEVRYDVSISDQVPGLRGLVAYQRDVELLPDDAERFVAMVREADRRERDGSDTVIGLRVASTPKTYKENLRQRCDQLGRSHAEPSVIRQRRSQQ
jgi:hypothetical protein